MAVRISGLKPTVTCPATVYLVGDNGQHIPHHFDVDFRRMTTEERNALNEKYAIGYDVPVEIDAAEPDQTPRTKRAHLSNAELLDAIVVGWGKMLDENGEPVPYSHAERRLTENEYSGLEQAMVVSWLDHFFFNQREAAIKNSKAQSGTSSAETARAAT
ncbi:hypothetical protein [Acidovorax sp. LjRoot117]|uniref:hypothetical protein n=1 Tax=Acidovorax sp. LjRoot117 TaxID=3342255 RepID=UPI003ECCF5FE